MDNWKPISGPYCTPRDFDTFEPFPELPPIVSEQLDQWLNALRVQPVSAVEWDWAKNWAFGPRTINDSMWFWFERGNGWGWLGREENHFNISEGGMMMIPQGVPHMVGQQPGETCHVFAVHFYAQVYDAINLLDLLSFPGYFPPTPESPFAVASYRLVREFALRAPGWQRAMSGDIMRVLLYIIRFHGADLHIPGGSEGHPELIRLLPALKLVSQNFADPDLAVGDLAEQVFLSEGQFRKLFRRVIGVSPVRFIQRQRIERACVMLSTTEMSVERIAEACGFSDVPFFIRTFKAWTQLSPSRFRKAREA